MMEKENNREVHCREVREIMDSPPSWFVRWGTVVITVVVILAIFVFWTKFN
jgi:hypothetical protein